MTKRNSHFLRGLLIYALIYAVIAGAALGVFWKFIEAYELSRPLTAVNSFIADLTSQDIRVGAEVLVNTVDGNIQSPDQAFAVIEENISGPITAAKSGKESTSDRAVYKLRNNGHIIGSVAIVPGEKGSFDFTPWVVAETQFDFSWLLREKMSITVPAECSVSLNGNVLNKSYITEADICYPVLEDFAGDFPMPTLVTYTAGDILGDFPFVVTNAEGEALDITPETDLNSLLPQCTTEEEAQLQKLTSDFLTAYINYTGSANRMAYANLSRLKQYVVKDGALSQR